MKGSIKSACIIVSRFEHLDKVRSIKKGFEERYGYVGTDAGFYEVPFLGNALYFSMHNVSVIKENNQ